MKIKNILLILAVVAIAIVAQTGVTVTFGGRTITIVPKPLSTVTFSISSATAAPDGSATLDVSIATSRRQPAGLQFDILVPSGVTNVVITAGAQTTAAGKTITCNVLGGGIRRCVIAGVNTNTIANGVVARVALVAAGPSTLVLQGVVASAKEGQALAVAIAPGGGVVTVLPTVSAVSCVTPVWDTGLPASTWNIEPGEQLSCTLTLTQAAPSGGFSVSPSVSGMGVQVPSPVVVPAGQSSVDFTLTGQ